jgi:2-succinyl-5-enolpyruvyl-6-hydroxy-3-cyclohexene-1-carboxylate synthase
MAEPSVTFARVLVDELARQGLRDAVVAPGSRSAPLAYALAAHDRVRLHVRHDERSAAFLALGLALGSGRPAAVVCTSGTAAANLHPAVIEADLSAVPLVVLTADRPPELRGTGANQTIDQVGLYGRSVRWFAEVGVPEGRDGEPRYWRSLAARAAAEARGALGGAPGPVHLNCPLREPLVGEPAAASGGAGAVVADRTPVVADLTAVTRAERGVVVAGHGAPDGLPALAEVVGWPLLAEPHSGARTGPAALCSHDALLRHEPFAAAHRPEVAVVGGKPGLSRALLGWLDGVRQVAATRPGRFADPARNASEVVVADAVVAEPAPGAGRWLATWRDADAVATGAIDALLDADEAPSEPRTARDLGACLPDGTALVAASSMPIRDLDAFLRPRDGLRVLSNRGASGIDGFTSTAAGVALVHDGPVCAIAGDLSLLHDAGGLLVPPGGPRADLVAVVLNNDGGAIFSLLPHAGHADFERLFGTPHGIDLAMLAATYRAGHRLVDRAADLAGAVGAARADGGIQLVEVRTDRVANAALHRRLLAAVSAALEG